MSRRPDPARRQLAERDLPGIGKAYSLDTLDGARLLAVVHQTSRRDIYVTPPGVEEPTASVSLSDDQAREFGAALAGAFYKPAALEQVEAVVDGLLIDWVTLRDGSIAAGRTIAELEVRRRTRMTIVALVRPGAEPIIAPEPHERLASGDRIIVVGRPDDLPGLVALVAG
jgi:TrkA domain protein